MQFANVNNVALHYDLRRADIQKPVLVFINSLGTDFRIWENVRERLGDDVTSLVYDKRGHGLSDVGETPYTIELLANDLIGLLELLDLRKTIICGLSVGGLIAQAVYAARSDLVAGLVLSSTAHKIGDRELWDVRISAVANDGLRGILENTMARWFTDAFRRPDHDIYRGYCNMFARQPPDGYVATCAAIREANFGQTARNVMVPTICLVGDQDGSTPPTLVRELADLIPGAGFSVISGCGHLPCVEQPDAFVGLVRRFLHEIICPENTQ